MLGGLSVEILSLLLSWVRHIAPALLRTLFVGGPIIRSIPALLASPGLDQVIVVSIISRFPTLRVAPHEPPESTRGAPLGGLARTF